ncbi:MAG: PAS domain S-box protein, partial [Bacteroidota bacterium]
LRDFINSDFELTNKKLKIDTDYGTEYFLYNLKGIVNYARIEQIQFNAIRYTTIHKEKSIYTELIEKSADIFITLDEDFNIQFANKAAETLGIEGDRSHQLSILSFVLEDNYDIFRDNLKKVAGNNERKYLTEIPFRNKDYSTAYFDCVLYKLPDVFESSQIALELRIIEERLALENEYEKQQKFLSDLLNFTDEVITIVNKEGYIVYESENMDKQFGYSKTVRNNTYGFDYIAPEFTQKVHEDFEKVKAFTTYQSSQPIRFLSKNGQWEDVILKQVNMLENPLVNGIVLKFSKSHVSREITQEKHEKNEMFQALLNNSPRVYMMLDINSNIVFVNDTINEIFGFEADELQGSNLYEFIKTEEVTALKKNLQFLSTNPREVLQATFYFKNAKGVWRKTDNTINALIKNNDVNGYLIQLDDVTEKVVKETDEAFRARFYNSILNSIENILLFTDLDANVQYVSANVVNVLGYQLKGNLKDRLHSSSHQKLTEAFTTVKSNPTKKVNFDAQIIDKEGKWKNCGIVVQNAQRKSKFRGVVLEISMNSKAITHESVKNGIKQDDNTKVEHILFTWLNKHKPEGVAFFKEDGSIFYKNKKIEDLLNTTISNNQSIANAIDQHESFDTLLKEVTKKAGTIVEETFSLKESKINKTLIFRFANLLKEPSINAIALSVTKNEASDNLRDRTETIPNETHLITHKEKRSKALQDSTEDKTFNKIQENTTTKEQEDKTNPSVLVSEKVSVKLEKEAITNDPLQSQQIHGEPELVNINDELEEVIQQFEGKFAEKTVISKEFKTENWIACTKHFVIEIFENIFSFLSKNSKNTGQIMVTAKKDGNFSFVVISENFSENTLSKIADNFKTGEQLEGEMKMLYEQSKTLESYKGNIKIESEREKGISISIQLPAKIGISF